MEAGFGISPKEWRRVAYHEAGHAVAAHALGAVIHWVRHLPCALDSAVKSGCSFEWTSPMPPAQSRQAPAIATIAGPLAEWLCQRGTPVSIEGTSPDDFLSQIGPEANSDLETIERLIALDIPNISPEHRKRIYVGCADRAMSLLARQWPAVEAVAGALMDKGLLSHEEALAILQANIQT
jgi:hypothetical protein